MKTEFDWSELAFGSKKPIRELNATFIAAPRKISEKRFTQLIKRYLPLGNIVIGLAKEPFVLGFEDQPQFQMLELADIERIIHKVNMSTGKNKLFTLHYSQREQKYLFEKLGFRRVVFINGSWKFTFHTSETYYALMRAGIPYEQESPFYDETEAREYDVSMMQKLHGKYDKTLQPGVKLTAIQMLDVAQKVAYFSFDHSFQTGVALGKKTKSDEGYELLATTFNKVVPYQTYAWHHGPSREINFSPPGDLNFYDAVHAEVELIIKAGVEHIDLADTTLFINLLPCPSCARMFAETEIAEFVYREDHSAGYAVKMLELAGKKVRRVV